MLIAPNGSIGDPGVPGSAVRTRRMSCQRPGSTHRHWTHRHTTGRHGGQAGYGLIEVLIAIVLMGTVIAALSAAMLTLLATTASTSSTQRMQAALTSYTESLKAGTYLACASTGSPPVGSTPTPAQVQVAHDGDSAAYRPAAGSGITVEVVDVAFLSAASAASPSSGPTTTMVNGVGGYQAQCPSTGDAGRQLLTVRVTQVGRTPIEGQVVIAVPSVATP